MSLSSDLWKLREKRLLEEKLKEQKSEEIAPVKTVTEEKAQDDSWVKSSEIWDDGYQFGDVLKTGWISARDLSQNILGGVLEIGEAVVDTGAYLGGLFSYYNPFNRMLNPDIAEENKKKTEEFINSDLYDGTEVIKSISNEDLVKQIIGVGTEEGSIFGEKSDSLAQSGGQLAAQLAANAVLPGSGMALMATTAFGSEVENALNQGATFEEAGLSAAISAGAEVLTEKIGGISFGGKTLTDAAFSKLSKNMTNKVAKVLITSGKVTADALAEGGEEILSGYMGAIGQKLTYMEDKEIEELFSNEDLLESFIGGTVLGGLGGGGSAVMSISKGVDPVSGLTKNERKVVEKVYKDALAEKDGKVSNREKSKLWNEVVEKMGRGEISTDIIEEVLGDKTYKDYKNTIEAEESVMKELEELYEGDELQQQIDDILNNSNRFQIKNQLSNEVSELVKGDRLSESYNEKANRSRQFEADVTKYDPKHRDTIQKAIDSGILNNTRKTHEFVDIIAKISADKGVSFDFLNNQKLKESGFAVDGKQVNGLVTESGISINIDSPKAWQSTVGHEITHVLEGTDMYDALQQTLFDYAKSRKGTDSKFDSEYKERLYNTRQLYKDVKGYEGVDGFTKIKNEVTADLVGDYLFTDEKFIKHLSAKNRNVFEKIYDEIKYLCKVATAGSKEARELERVKKAFEDAYRADGKAKGDTKYSLDMVEKVQPKSDKWSRTHTTEEAMARFPNMWNVSAEESEVRNPTQITSTVNSYRKIYNFLQNEGFNGTILDASSGLGYGTKAGIEEYGFNVEDIEPYPDKSYKPKYQDYSALDKQYDAIISNAVLNVLPQDQRDALVVKMGELLNDGGRMFINVRGKDVESLAKTGKNIHLGNMEWIETVKGSYQKGFTKPELVAYLQDALGDGFTVEPTNMFGAVSAVVTKDGAVKYSLTDSDGKNLTNEHLSKTDETYFDAVVNKDWETAERLVEEAAKKAGYTKVVYHGTDARFTEFDTDEESTAREQHAWMADYPDGTIFLAEDYDVADGYGERVMNLLLDTSDMKVFEEPDMYAHRAMDDKYGYEVYNYPVIAVKGKDMTIYATLDNTAVKSADTVTYGDGGEIIPLSERFKRNNSDIRYSLSVDSEGRRLSEGQAKRFKDSQVRDENGNLKAVYHGSPKDFNTFSLEYLGTNGTAEGYGFYFTDKKHIAEGYSRGHEGQQNGEPGKLFEVYLDIKKPLSDKEVTMTRSQFKKFLTTLNNQVDADGERLDVLSNYGDVEWEGLNKVLNYAMEIEYDGSDSDVNLVHSIINGCGDMKTVFNVLRKTLGYDGIIVNEATWGGDQTIYVAFHPEQIKNINNLNPTDDPDIRYSVSEVTDAQNENGLDARSEVSFSLSKDSVYMDKAIEKNNSSLTVDSNLMESAKVLRERIATRMNQIKDRGLVGLPEDIEGNTYIANSSYDGTEENTTICPRSLASEAFVDAVSEYLGRPLTVEEQIYISQDLQGRSLTPECTYCYVATDRKAYRAFLGEYVNQRDAVLQKLSDNPNADVSRSGELYKEFLNGRKDTNPMYSRFKMWVDAYQNGTPMVEANHLSNINKLMGDINSEFGEALKPQIVDAMKYAQSASWAKKRVNYVAYNGHILNWKQDRINKLNSHYGLRMYSFSDFHPAFVLENMQMITDASVRGLKMLGYTKDTDFVEIFAPSGMNINVSTFGFESGGNVYENNLIGAEWEKAKALREHYPNVGVTFVATNDTIVEWALGQDWIDVVIPYHLVRTGAEVARAFNYTNYTSESADTKSKEWAKGDKKSIAPTEHNNDLATYLEALEKNHLKPRFERFIDNPNYMKLVNECRQPASVSKPVQPVFNEEAAMKALAKLEANGYYQPIGGSVDRMYEIAAEVAEGMTKELAPVASLSTEGKQTNYGNYSTPATELRYEAPVQNVAPIAENAATKDSNVAEATDLFPDDLSPIQTELDKLVQEKDSLEARLYDMVNAGEVGEAFNQASAEWNALNERIKVLENGISEMDADRVGSLTDADAPPEMEAPYYKSKPVTVDDPFEDRDWYDIGNRKVKAYMYENPEVKPFFQEEAMGLYMELNDTIKGERWYNDEVYYASGGEKGFGGTKRHTSASMEELLDSWHMSYADIEKGLKAIIEDNGAENIAAAKKLEFMLNDRLLHGYKDFYSGGYVAPNQDYINLLNEKQITEYSKEAFDSFMANADKYAPPVEEDIAPVVETVQNVAPEVKTSKGGEVKGQQAIYKEAVRNESPKTAQILTEEPKVQKKNSWWSRVKNTVLDKGMVFEELSQETGNRELQARWNSIRYAEGKAQKLIGEGNAFTNSLKSMQDAVEKSGKTKRFYEYLYHMHNVDRMTLEERFKDTPNKAVFGDEVTAEVSRDAAAELAKANPEFKQWAEDIYTYNKYLRELLVDGGVISSETAKLWEEMYPHYVPIRRVGDTGMNINVPLDTGRTGVNAPIKRATGGNQDILPLFDTMGQRTIQTYKAIAKNRFGVELKNTLGTTIANEATSVDEAIDIGAQDGLLQEGKNGQKPTFTVFENGEKVTFEITEEMYDAMKPTSELLSGTSKTLNTISNIRRGTLTEYNPWFLLKNAVKDVQDVLINSQHAARTYAAMPKAIKQMATKGHWYQEYMSNGGDQNTYFDKQTNTFAKENKALEIAKTVTGLNAIAKANNIVEMLPRLSEYIASREAKRSVDVAMLDAARVTTNFAAGGDLTKFANRNGFTFLNASVQGAVQQARNIYEAKQNGLKGWVNLAAKFTLAGLPAVVLNHLIWGDDEEYEELSDYVKDSYYIVGKYGDGQFVRIPKGRTVAVLQSAFEQMGNLVTGNDEVDLGRFLELAVSNLAPNNPLDNNILSPIVQVASNKTWYGEDLVPTRLQDLPAAEQYDESTDAISRWLGETFNISPYKANYLLDQYSGVIGDTFLPMLTPEAESGDNSFLGNMIAPLKDMFTTDSVMNNQNVSDFYNKVDELTVNANSSKATDEDVLKYKYINSINADLSELYQQKREIQNSDLADDEKYAQVREIQQQIDNLTREGLNSYEDVSVEENYATVADRHYRWHEPGEDSEAEAGWQKITEKQLAKQEKVTSGLNISPNEYWGNKEEYDYAYDNPEKYAVAKSVGGYENFKTYSNKLNDIKSDKDGDGKSISGSRKEKVINYVNGLDIDYGQKIILFKSEYKSDNTYNYDIVDYLNSRNDISYDEMVTILKELGFIVSSNGYVTW